MPGGTEYVPTQAHFGDDKVPVEEMPVAGTKAEPPQREAHGNTTLKETRNLDDATYVERFSGEATEREGYGEVE